MSTAPIAFALCLLMSLPSGLACSCPPEWHAEPDESAGVNVPSLYSHLPPGGALSSLSSGFFTENMGQLPGDVMFSIENAHFLADGVRFRVLEQEEKAQSTPNGILGIMGVDGRPAAHESAQMTDRFHVYEMMFLDACRTSPRGVGILPHRSNFFLGDDPSGWHSDVRNYDKIVYTGLYDGIDLVFSNMAEGLKYQFEVAPGADASQIKIGYRGVDVSTDGQTVFIGTSVGMVIDGGLNVYQPEGNCIVPVQTSIRIDGGVQSFEMKYDNRYTLIIDPLVASTFIGGSAYDSAVDICNDSAGNIYVTGTSASANFPTTVGAYNRTYEGNVDSFVVKMNAALGTLSYSTYLGGNDWDQVRAMAVDTSSNVYLSGETSSDDFPTTSGAFCHTASLLSDIFVSKLNSAGSGLVYSGHLSAVNQNLMLYDLAIDSAGAAYITGEVPSSSLFPVTSNAYDKVNVGGDAFLMKINSAGSSIVYSTFLGGTNGETGHTVAVDSAGCAVIAGQVGGIYHNAGFPTTPGAYYTVETGNQAFVTKFDSTGSSLIFSTFLCGDIYPTIVYDIKLDSANNICTLGYAGGNDFPYTPGAYCCTGVDGGIFLTKMKSDGKSLLYSTWFGGSGRDYAFDLGMDSSNNAYILGYTNSTDFPCTEGGLNETLVGNQSLIVMKFNDTEALLYSTYLGGEDGYTVSGGITVTSTDTVYVAGRTNASKYPTTNGAYDTSLNGQNDSVVSKVTTLLKPGKPTGLNASTGNRWVYLNWTAPVSAGSTAITGYGIYRGTSNITLSFIQNAGLTDHFNDTSVTNGINYYYAVTASNSIGEGRKGNQTTIMPGIPPTPPTVPSAAPGKNNVTLSWSPPSDDIMLPILNYTVYKGSAANLLSKLTLINKTSYVDSGLTNGQTYYYCITATNIKGEGAGCTVLNATPGAPPSQPLGIASSPGNRTVGLAWAAPADIGGHTITNYTVYRGVGGSPLSKLVTLGVNRTFQDAGLENGLSYSYAVTAINKFGEGPRSVQVTAVPGVSSGPPENISLETGNRLVSLKWDPPLDNGGFEVTGYRIYRGSVSDVLDFIADSSGNSFNDTGVTNGQIYFYAVSAANTKGEGNRTMTVSGLVGVRPGAPTLSANTTKTGILLCWTLKSDGGIMPSRYNIYKGIQESALEYLANVTETRFLDENVTVGKTYYYSISAVNTKGEGNRSEPLKVDMVPPNAPPVATLVYPPNDDVLFYTNPTLQWNLTDEDGDALSADVYLATNKSTVESHQPGSKLGTVTYPPLLTMTKPLTAGATYYWTVVPSDGKSFGKCTSGVWTFIVWANATLNHPPEFKSSPATSASVGVEWRYAPNVTDPDPRDTVTLFLVSGPVGMALKGRALAWTPVAGQLGVQKVMLGASDDKIPVFQTFNITVSDKPPVNHPPSIRNLSNVSLKAGTQLSLQLEAVDPDGDPVTLRKVSGPDALTVLGNGSVTWLPGPGDKGKHTVVVELSDGKALVNATFTVEVLPNGSPSNPGSGLENVYLPAAIVVIIATTVAVALVVIHRKKKT